MGLKTAIPGKCAFFRGLYERIRNKSGIFALVNLKIQSLCLYKKFPAGIVGANPGKFTRQKPKRKPKAAPHTRPDTVKSPQQTKRNREFPQSPKFPYLCGVFLPSYRPQRYFDRPAGIRPGGVFVSHQLLCGLFARIRSAKSGRFLQK